MINFLQNQNQNFVHSNMHNFVNFAQQPMQGGMVNVLTAFDLYRDEIDKTEVFDNADLFLPAESGSTFKSMEGEVIILDEGFSNFYGESTDFNMEDSITPIIFE
jgi:hypothetical protein